MSAAQPQIANANRVTSFLFVGGAPGTGRGRDAAEDLAELSGLGLTHVLDCRAEADGRARDAVSAAELGYWNVPLEDDLSRPHGGWFDAGIAAAREALANPGGVVLTHCQGGRGRGPSMGFAVLLDQGWEPAPALAAITAVRPQSDVPYAEHALEEHIARNRMHADLAARWREQLRSARAEAASRETR